MGELVGQEYYPSFSLGIFFLPKVSRKTTPHKPLVLAPILCGAGLYPLSYEGGVGLGILRGYSNVVWVCGRIVQ
jgi:hypothetical protein